MTARRVGGRDIVASGSVVQEGAESIEVQVGNATIEIRFETTEGDNADIRAEQVGPNLIRMTMINWDSPIGISSFSPVAILNGRRLFFATTVHAIGAGPPRRLLSYTFSLGDPATATPSA